MRSWSVMAITSSCADSAASMISETDETPSDARLWMCRSARPISERPSSDVRPDREEHRPPLFGCVGDGALESSGFGVQEGGQSVAPVVAAGGRDDLLD